MGAPLALVRTEGGGQEGRDFRAVDVVAAALALRLEHVREGTRGIGGERDGVLPRWSVIQWIDGRKCSADAWQKWRVACEESFEVRGRGCCQRLLDFLRAR